MLQDNHDELYEKLQDRSLAISEVRGITHRLSHHVAERLHVHVGREGIPQTGLLFAVILRGGGLDAACPHEPVPRGPLLSPRDAPA